MTPRAPNLVWMLWPSGSKTWHKLPPWPSVSLSFFQTTLVVGPLSHHSAALAPTLSISAMSVTHGLGSLAGGGLRGSTRAGSSGAALEQKGSSQRGLRL